jgi:succinyl-CoA synthetase beta subunit
MNIHEYQARELFAKFGVATQPGGVAFTPEEAEQVASKMGGGRIVVKAQIHAGGRGKGTFKTGFKGGVHLCDTPLLARDLAARMLGQVLVTHQTGPEGKEVGKVFVGEAVDIAGALLPFSWIARPQRRSPSPAPRGVDIESVAEKPQKILRSV